jgi:hypothetical protein
MLQNHFPREWPFVAVLGEQTRSLERAVSGKVRHLESGLTSAPQRQHRIDRVLSAADIPRLSADGLQHPHGDLDCGPLLRLQEIQVDHGRLLLEEPMYECDDAADEGHLATLRRHRATTPI